MLLPIQGPLPSQQEIINLIVGKPPAIVEQIKEPTLEEKIKKNAYNCNTDTQYIRADNAHCLAKPITTRQPARKAATEPIRGSQGNSYTPRNCTWYAKSRRPDLPNNLGDSISWVRNAAAQGLATGSTPKAGSIGQRGMHVVYIEAVNSDGTVYLSEMNYDYNGGFRYRTANASDFTYIY